MRDGRAVILISKSIWKRNLQENTEEKIYRLLLNTKAGKAREELAEKLIGIIENPENSEADILKIMKKMSKT